MAVVDKERKVVSSILKLAATATLPVAVWLYKDMLGGMQDNLDPNIVRTVKCVDEICSLRFVDWEEEKNK